MAKSDRVVAAPVSFRYFGRYPTLWVFGPPSAATSLTTQPVTP
jgi:hypothetical protein